MWNSLTDVSSAIAGLKARRKKLADLIDFPVVLWSGSPLGRNFPANHFPFRASSHFLYFAGLALENAAIKLDNGKLELYWDHPPASATLWYGETPSREEVGRMIGADQVYPLAKLAKITEEVGTIAVQDYRTYQQQIQLLQRPLSPSPQFTELDLALARAIIELRSQHDPLALAELRQAAEVSVKAHLAGMRHTKQAKTEAEIRGAMEGMIIAHNMTCAYNSIVTVRGDILHNENYHHSLQPDDLLLADVGAETPNGWAADITRTWAVGGKFSPSQRDIYQIVLQAHDDCIAMVKPGIEYQAIHLQAAQIIAEGLVDLGILRGHPQDLVELDAHALFFPHGIGHLLGLDVHDMEDLGDLAGYSPGRNRSDRFGLRYLRLHRPLLSGMVVTIEPGFYQVPAIINDPQLRTKYQNHVNWARLEQFQDVKGIRIEDDVLVTDTGREVLTAALPTKIEAIESKLS